MTDVLVTAVLIWMTILLAAVVIFAVKSRSDSERLLAVDAITLILIAILALFSIMNRQSYYLDAALALALMSFVGTVVAARRLSSRRVL
jgi:multicomponent Na+:H+ antiporter subunit F